MDKIQEYFKGDELAASVWRDKYALKSGDKLIEQTPDDMHKRMAKEFTRIESCYFHKALKKINKKFGSNKYKNISYLGKKYYTDSNKGKLESIIYEAFKDFKYIIPAGSMMATVGSNNYSSISNCFVIGQPEDSYNSINQFRQIQSNLMKRRGGVGKDLSKLRPRGAKVNNAALHLLEQHLLWK